MRTDATSVVYRYDTPPGHYDVTVVLGDEAGPAATEVRAEARRMMVAETRTGPGELVRRTFTVNVRAPRGEPTKPQTGGPGLVLTFTGGRPRVQRVEVAPAAPHRTVFLAGDSTVCDQDTPPFTGWGQMLPQHFGQGVSVANYAASGEGAASFLADPRLAAALCPLIAPDDLVLIQLGHNDKQATAADFRTNLTTLVTAVRERGGAPVLITPLVRRLFTADGGLSRWAVHVNERDVDLPAQTREVARTLDVPLVDLTEDSRALVERLGPQEAQRLYLYREERDNTHLSEYGANEVATLVLTRLREAGLAGRVAAERFGI